MFDNDIPIIMLLIGGDFATLVVTCKGLAVGTPVVVVRVRISCPEPFYIKMKLIHHIKKTVTRVTESVLVYLTREGSQVMTRD